MTADDLIALRARLRDKATRELQRCMFAMTVEVDDVLAVLDALDAMLTERDELKARCERYEDALRKMEE